MLFSRSRLPLEIYAWLVVGLVCLVGVGFLLSAAFLALDGIYPTPEAAALTGAGALAVGGTIAFGIRIGQKRRPPQSDLLNTVLSVVGEGLEGDRGAELGAMVGQQTANWIRGSAKATAFAAAVIGFVLGASPSLRRALGDLVKPAE